MGYHEYPRVIRGSREVGLKRSEEFGAIALLCVTILVFSVMFAGVSRMDQENSPHYVPPEVIPSQAEFSVASLTGEVVGTERRRPAALDDKVVYRSFLAGADWKDVVIGFSHTEPTPSIGDLKQQVSGRYEEFRQGESVFASHEPTTSSVSPLAEPYYRDLVREMGEGLWTQIGNVGCGTTVCRRFVSARTAPAGSVPLISLPVNADGSVTRTLELLTEESTGLLRELTIRQGDKVVSSLRVTCFYPSSTDRCGSSASRDVSLSPSRKPVAAFTMSGGGVLPDLAPPANDIVINGQVRETVSALESNGSDIGLTFMGGFGEVQQFPSWAGAMSLMFWFNPNCDSQLGLCNATGSPGVRPILTIGTGLPGGRGVQVAYHIQRDELTVCQIGGPVPICEGLTVVAQPGWNHYALTYSDNPPAATFYRNGVAVQTIATAPRIAHSPAMSIGKSLTGTTSGFSVDELSIHQTHLTPDEIRASYELAKGDAMVGTASG